MWTQWRVRVNMPTDKDEIPDEGEYAVIEYTDDNNREKTEKGYVSEVDTDPDAENTEIYIELEEGGTNTVLQYHQGTYEGEEYAIVGRYSEFSGHHDLGDDASIRELD